MGRNRAFQVALVISAAFHLSMVTVFSIQIPFTRPVVVYYPFDIVDPYTFEPVFRPGATALRAPALTDLLRGQAEADPRDAPGASSQMARMAALPTVDLPQLDYANFDLLSIRDMQLELERTVESARSRPPAINLDRQLERIADTLVRQPLLEGFDGDRPRGIAPQTIVHPVTQGVVAEIDWLGPPTDRQVLFAPPLAALDAVSPLGFRLPVSLDVRVAPSGRVESVQAPMDIDLLMATRLEAALERWRFEPISQEMPQSARVTLRRAFAPGEIAP